LPLLDNLQAFLSSISKTAGRRPGLLGLDVSKKSIGVAGADADWRMATPLVTIRRTKLKNDIQQLESLLRERAAAAAVIGLPLNMDGSEGPRCQAIRQFARDLDQALALPILLWDERLSTFAAEERADEMGLRGKARAEMLDALAAAEILQDVLNAIARQP
jgi:putative Holliday junction resolvase